MNARIFDRLVADVARPSRRGALRPQPGPAHVARDRVDQRRGLAAARAAIDAFEVYGLEVEPGADRGHRALDLLGGDSRGEVEQQTQLWQEAARRARALGHVVDKWRGEERLAVERQEQRDTDERATGLAARRPRG